MLLYLWSQFAGVNQPKLGFTVSLTAVGISAASMILAIVSYKVIPDKLEKLRSTSALGAYILLLAAVGLLTAETGTSDSPFLALWMVASVFSGIFGTVLTGILLLLLTAFAGFMAYEGQLEGSLLVGVILAGYLPLFISYVLWHTKSSNEQHKERAYYDLANELNQVANKSDTVISAISDGVIAINNEGNIELINPAALRLTGWGKQDAVKLDYKSVLQLLTKDGAVADKSADPVFAVLTTNQPVRRDDLQLQTNSGKKMNIEIIVSPIGRIGAGAIIVFRDVTKELAEERAQAEFISTASHEMRTPVASIEGYLGLALNPATAKIDDKARDFITKAHESAQHLGRLFQDLLDVTKAEDGRLSNNPKVLDVVTYAKTIVEGLKPKADEKGLRIFFKPLTDEDAGGMRNLQPVYYVDVDADHLREVIANLTENAIKYTPQGEVMIDVQGDDEHVVISIKDSGIGIPTEDIPHLFQKFYRVDNSDTREIGGTGLGLYLCRRLVETMGGRIWVESEYKKGSTFFVELPRISHEEAQRLIDASAEDAVKAAVPSKYLNEEVKVDPEAEKRHQQALATPIVMMHDKSTDKKSIPPKPVAVIKKGERTIEPLASPETVTPADEEPLRPHNPMVVPSSIQNMPSNLQKAATPAPAAPASAPPTAPVQSAAPPKPTPAPVVAPAPTPVKQPAVVQPQVSPPSVPVAAPPPVAELAEPEAPKAPPAPPLTMPELQAMQPEPAKAPTTPSAEPTVEPLSADAATPIVDVDAPDPTPVPAQAPPVSGLPTKIPITAERDIKVPDRG